MMDILHQPTTQLIKKRSAIFSETVEIKNINPCISDRCMLFSNYINKANLEKFLTEKLEKNCVDVIQCPMDKDTTIIKIALTAAKVFPVNVFANDTDILFMTNSCTDMYDTYKTNVKQDQITECHSVTNILNALQNHSLVVTPHLLYITSERLPYSRN